MDIQQSKNWLGQRLNDMKDIELLDLFEEIYGFRNEGVLKGEKLRSLEVEFSENVSHARKGEGIRIVEDAVLFEMGRRFYNRNTAKTATALEEATEKQAAIYMSDPDTRVFISRNNELRADEWQYSVVVENSDGFWLDSFGTEEEAETFIRKHNLKKVGDD